MEASVVVEVVAALTIQSIWTMEMCRWQKFEVEANTYNIQNNKEKKITKRTSDALQNELSSFFLNLSLSHSISVCDSVRFHPRITCDSL